MESFEVGIVGGGIHGVAAAFHLTQRGTKTVLFEKGYPASGPTGRSSAVCRAYYTNEFLAGVARDGIDILRRLPELSAGADAAFHETGALFLHGPEEVDAVASAVAGLGRVGVQAELLSVDDLRRRFPEFNVDDVACGVWEAAAGHADPAAATTGLYEAALATGHLTGRLRIEIVGIEPAREGVVVTTAAGASTRVDALLIAAGPWTAPLARLVGAELPLTVERHWVVTCGWGRATPIPFVYADVVGGYYAKPEGTDLFCLGPLSAEPEVDADDFDETVHAEEAERMLAPAARRIPGLEDADFRGGWASLYDVSPDWQPVLGAIAEGVYVDAGTSGHGFKLAPAWGAHVADLVTGGTVDPGLAQFSPDRFARGELVAAGFGDVRILG